MYFSAKRWPEQFLQFPIHTFSENRTVYFYSISTINWLYLSSGTIASGKLIVILNVIFLPVCPQGKRKVRNEAWYYNQAWHMYRAWPSLSSLILRLPKTRRDGKVKTQTNIKKHAWCMTPSEKRKIFLLLFVCFLKRTKLLLSQEDTVN